MPRTANLINTIAVANNSDQFPEFAVQDISPNGK